MQAYATAEMAPSAELRVLDARPARHELPRDKVAPGNAILDELIGQLADLVADKVATRLLARPTEATDEWLDTARGRVPRHSPRSSSTAGGRGQHSRRAGECGLQAVLPPLGS